MIKKTFLVLFSIAFVSQLAIAAQIVSVFTLFAEKKFIALENRLKQNPALIFEKNQNGETLVHLAVQDPQNYHVVEKLISLGADVNAQDLNDDRPLHKALDSFLKNDCLDLNFFHIMQTLINGDWKANRAHVLSKNKQGVTPIHLAAKSKNLAIFSLVLKNLPDLNYLQTQDDYGRTPLMYAAMFGENPEVLHDIIAKTREVGIDAQDKNGNDALMNALLSNNFNMVGHLLKNKAPMHKKFIQALHEINMINSQLSSGSFALHYAVINPNWREAVPLLLDFGADVNVASQGGNTPLHIVAVRIPDSAEIIEFLVEHGANIDAKNVKGETPLVSIMSKSIVGNNVPRRNNSKLKICENIKTLISLGASSVMDYRVDLSELNLDDFHTYNNYYRALNLSLDTHKKRKTLFGQSFVNAFESRDKKLLVTMLGFNPDVKIPKSVSNKAAELLDPEWVIFYRKSAGEILKKRN